MDVCEAEWSSDGSDGSDCSLDSRLVELDFDATRPKPLRSPTASCVPTEITTAQNLVDAVNRDLLPNDRQTLDDYYLTPLVASDDHGDLDMLIGIYRDLVAKFYISSPQLHQWKKAKQVFNNIVRLHNRYPKRAPAIHGFWLKHHSHVFLEEDKSEAVDFDAYL
ncbi:unnamed protein product [Clonostachys chloroleuca]|uniref:Uncharacterized protein n=1 Tax=Clonostachys chloroleuca TaxID=1926264 RepID=A0AA35PXN3_9HYPO|nr:unnamed protein product [Clonostachys chloroleuca]